MNKHMIAVEISNQCMGRAGIRLLATAILALTGCSTPAELKKIVLDESPGSAPAWVTDSKTAWEADGILNVRATQQIRGNERLSGCYDLARLNAKTLIVTEIQEEIRGLLTTHEASISENAEIVLSKSRSAEFNARAQGVRSVGEHFVRYRIGEEERIDCHVLSNISKDDYNRLKRAILYKVEEADPKLKEQIRQKHIDFFKAEETAAKGA